MKVKFSLTVGNFHVEEVVSFKEEMSDVELDEAFADWQSNYLDGHWARVKPEPKKKPSTSTRKNV